jgi:hypothetical protein
MIIIYAMSSMNPQKFKDFRQLEALIAGTLALMTHYAESGCPQAAGRILDNLLRLSAQREVPWELRAALAKLGSRWMLLKDHALAACRNNTSMH